jgi:hypothetical protein
MTTITTIQDLKSNLTKKEFAMLEEIVGFYSFDDNLCYTEPLTPSQKGVVGSLVKKGLVYDSFEGMYDDGYQDANWFPSEEVLDLYKLEHY